MKHLGLLAVSFYVIHGADLVMRGVPWDLLWACHVASLLVGLGCLAGSRRAVAVGLTWALFGLLMWTLDLATGGIFDPTSVLTHVGGPVAAVVALRNGEWPKGTWWQAAVAEAPLLLVTRLATPPAANVNLVFSIWPGWEQYFSGHTSYFCLVAGSAVAAYYVIERCARALASTARRAQCATSSSTG